MSLRVLFINDDPVVLAGLRASLRRHRRQWDMTFVAGQTAAGLVESHRYDVVVSELLLAGVDGYELLARVAQVQPGVIRVVLSATADQHGAMKATHVAHQYLSMPCEAAELIRRIERSEKLRSVLEAEHIVALGSLDRLPSPPQIYHDLQTALAHPDTTVMEVAALIERDPAISAKILQLVNSAFFSRMRRITNIQGAVSVLGLDLLQGLLLQEALYNSGFVAVPGLSLEHEAQHALAIALAARHIANRKDTGVAFTAGLVHDVGKLVLAERFGTAYGDVLARAQTSSRSLAELEREAFRVHHGEAGAYLLGVWGLPDSVVEAAAWHHQPCAVERVDLDVVAVVHLASAVVRRVPADPQLIEQLSLSERMPRWRAWFDEQEAA